MTNKEKYRDLCSKEKTIPIFLMDWWLDATCGVDGWEVAISETVEEIFGAMPYPVRKKWGIKLITMPRITIFMGPWIKYPSNQLKYASRLTHEMGVLTSLIDQLPAFGFYRQRFHYSITNWLPFYWKSFNQTTRYTYIVKLDSLEETFEGFKSNIRGKIRKAEKNITVTDQFPPKEFDRLHGLTFSRQGLKLPYPYSYFERFDNALASHNRRKIFYGVDAEGRVHSAVYLIWDDFSSYLLMVGEDPELRNSGAGILLVWEAMQYTKDVLKLNQFDFLGSMIEPIEIVRRSFGAIQTPYFQLQKTNSFLLKIASIFRKL